MTTSDLGRRGIRRSAALVGGVFALLTLLTHAANLGFVVVGARLLQPDEFSGLVALLGIVMIGLAPGMAVQALTAAGVLGRPVLVDRELGHRLGTAIGLVVAVVTFAAWAVLDLDGWVMLVAIPVAASLLPRTAVNEGLLQGHERFVTLGAVMVAGAAGKLATGALGMATIGTVDVAAAAIAVGYAVQLTASTIVTRRQRPTRARAQRAEVGYAVVAMAAVLVVVHLDAVLAPTQLSPLEAGRYATGVTAARATFWFPQFAVLLWFPRLVRGDARAWTLVGLAGATVLGVVAAAGAALLGPLVMELVFGAELGAIGQHLWRFAWIGAAGLGLQVLTLADLAAGRRHALPLSIVAAAAVATALVWGSPDGAAEAAVLTAVPLTACVAVGAIRTTLTREQASSR